MISHLALTGATYVIPRALGHAQSRLFTESAYGARPRILRSSQQAARRAITSLNSFVASMVGSRRWHNIKAIVIDNAWISVLVLSTLKKTSSEHASAEEAAVITLGIVAISSVVYLLRFSAANLLESRYPALARHVHPIPVVEEKPTDGEQITATVPSHMENDPFLNRIAFCPILQGPTREPATDPTSGQIFSKGNLYMWSLIHRTSPLSRLALDPSTVIVDETSRAFVEARIAFLENYIPDKPSI